MAIVTLFLGSMLGRVAGPIAQTWFENNTQMGRKILEGKRQQEREKLNEEYQRKRAYSKEEHQQKLEDLKLQFEYRRKESENQILNALSESYQKNFLKECWPLRDSFEAPLGFSLEYEDNQEKVKKCKLTTTLLPNGQEIVPLRFISALDNNCHPHASTVNSELSMFLVNYYNCNESHAVMSDIGAWKPDFPVNDASINYLYKGLKGQPVVVLAPEYTNSGTVIRFKLWSWGLGIHSNYPIGVDCGWIDCGMIYQRVIADEVRRFSKTLNKIQYQKQSKELCHCVEIIEKIEANKNILSKSDVEYLLSMLISPPELDILVRQKYNMVISNVYSCMTGIYSDAYHLTEYGTLPLLPSILPRLKGIGFLYPWIRDAYLAMINSAAASGTITLEQTADFETDLIESFNSCKASLELVQPISQDLKTMLFDIKESKSIKKYKHILEATKLLK